MTGVTSLLVRYLFRRVQRSLVAAAAIAFSVGLVVGTGTIMESLHQRMVETTKRDHGDYHLSVTGSFKAGAPRIDDHVAVDAVGRGNNDPAGHHRLHRQ